MTYAVPADRVSGDVTTSAVINTTVATDVLAAPGFGLRYRVVAIYLNAFRTATGIIHVSFSFGANAAHWRTVLSGTTANQWSDSAVPPFPGMVLGTVNQPLRLTHSASAVSQIFQYVIYYYIDNMA